MKRAINKASIKDLLGELPLFPEVYWSLRQSGKAVTASFDLTQLENVLPEWVKQTAAGSVQTLKPKNVLVFATLRYWVEYAAAMSLTLAGQGHPTTLAFLPYAVWQKPLSRFDVRRQNSYALKVFSPLTPMVKVVSFLSANRKSLNLPEALETIIREVAFKDTQYTLQMEKVDLESDLYALRLERNLEAAKAAFIYFKEHSPDVIVIPNGTILEFGAVYQTAKYLKIPIVTFEFGEQQERIWLAQNSEVMRQDTTDLWAVRHEEKLTDDQHAQVRTLFAARQRASVWENFARRWQGVPSEGGEQVRASLKLDARPIVLLATNVIGDSLTLGRQVFSDSMTEWLYRTVKFLANRQDVQFIVRIHPGELITKGPSVADVVNQVLNDEELISNRVDHIHLIPADAKINTYDLVEIADVGLVYTTTVGLEMAMSGVPVVVVGNTHYRNRGFSQDPDTWDGYFELLERILTQPEKYKLTRDQVDLAWNYAYRFFFEYPHPFPWHLVHFWDDIAKWPIERVLSKEGQDLFAHTFDYLLGEPIVWK